MILSSIYNKIVLLSPRIETMLRGLYWRNAKWLRKYTPVKHLEPSTNNKTDFDKVIEYLKSRGIKEGSLLVVHSSYAALEMTDLMPDEIIQKLLDLIGPTGTLAMPAIRKYKEEPKYENILSTDMGNIVCTYDTKKTKVSSGVLPVFLMKRNDCEISRFPLNPMVSVGPLAKKMMQHNLDGNNPSPHGVNSSWKFCLDHNAIVIGLGIDLSHNLTMIHVVEEAFPNWPVRNWYRKRKFIIKEGDFQMEKEVLERKPKWGMLHFAERNFAEDLRTHTLLKTSNIDNIGVDIAHSKPLFCFLNERKYKAYPYVIDKKDLIKK